ncbi:MAG: hypothetical protein KDC76_01310 [Bacteroidetes bacterium]|nr:hypothetical protein [Bacteroidota bacterium]
MKIQIAVPGVTQTRQKKLRCAVQTGYGDAELLYHPYSYSQCLVSERREIYDVGLINLQI